MTTAPPDYAKQKMPKDDGIESAPRKPSMRFTGPPRNCKICHRNHPTFIDNVCRRCLGDVHRIALLQLEIAKVFPGVMALTLPKMCEKLWADNQKLRARLKARPAESRVGVR